LEHNLRYPDLVRGFINLPGQVGSSTFPVPFNYSVTKSVHTVSRFYTTLHEELIYIRYNARPFY
jgi:hypothetical protein